MNTIYKSEKGKEEIRAFYEVMLDRFSFSERTFVETSLGRTFVLSSGSRDNPPLILLHGSGSNTLSWMGEVESLSQTYCVYCLDLPGEPGMSSTERFSTTEGDSFSQWLREVIDVLQLDSPRIAGLSLGGWGAIRFALDYPEKTAGVIALAPSGIVKTRADFLLKTIYYSLRGEKGIRKLLSTMFDGEPVMEEVVRFQLLLTRYFRFRTEIPPLFTDQELLSIRVPLTMAIGARDYVFDGLKAVERLKLLNPAVQTVLLEKGHALTDIRPYL